MTIVAVLTTSNQRHLAPPHTIAIAGNRIIIATKNRKKIKKTPKNFTFSLFFRIFVGLTCKKITKKVLRASFFLVILLSFQSGFCKTIPFVVFGKWECGNPSEIQLFEVVAGRLEQVSVTLVQDDKSFALSYTPDREGFFVVGIGKPEERIRKFTFYFKPGDHAYIVVNENGSYDLVGENSRENITMKAWYDFTHPLDQNLEQYLATHSPSAYNDFFYQLKEKTEKAYRALRTGNKTFDQTFVNYRYFDLMYYAVNFAIASKTALSDEKFPKIYSEMLQQDFNNCSVLRFPYPLLPDFWMAKNDLIENQSFTEEMNLDLIENLSNDTLKGEMLIYLLCSTTDRLKMLKFNEIYASHISTEEQRKRFNKEIERINRLYLADAIGKPALDFTYKDLNDNEISLSDFKGKVVLLNIWATWCSPCLAEMPEKAKMKKKFAENEPIVFLEVSIDNPRDVQKWKNFVNEQKLSGVHLFGNIDGPTNIRKLYNISGIPRFLLFDKDGNIVSLDAPHPNSSDLLPMLKKLLK